MTRVTEDYNLLFRLCTKFGVRINLGGQIMNEAIMAQMLSQFVWKEDDVRTIRKKTKDALTTIRENDGRLGRSPIGLQRNERNDGFEIDTIGALVKMHRASGNTPEDIVALLPAFRAPGSLRPRRLTLGGVKRIIATITALDAGSLDDTIARRRSGWERSDCNRDGCDAKDVRRWQHAQVHVERDARDEFEAWARA